MFEGVQLLLASKNSDKEVIVDAQYQPLQKNAYLVNIALQLL